MTVGYIAISRSLFEHALFKDRPSWHVAWEKLIAAAAWKPQGHVGRWGTAHVERGQFAMTVRSVAALLGWSPSGVVYFLEKLEAAEMISRKSVRTKINTQNGGRNSQRITIITICNYDKFQPKGRVKSGGLVQGSAQGLVQEMPELPGLLDESLANQHKQTNRDIKEGTAKGLKKPSHGTISKDGRFVWYDYGRFEWLEYAKDYREVKDCDIFPETRPGGRGNWFVKLGERARPRQSRRKIA